MSIALPVIKKENERYTNILVYCLSSYKNRLKILSSSYDQHTLKLTVEVIDSHEVEFIRIRNTTFFSYSELVDKLLLKLEQVCCKY